ncbi:acyl-CoA dehydrogenase family protein [Nocardia sp. CA-120079]|uniref:acyl-CoA dehydrogenase family protein n=1 Tax=Nocardia sp. CA-120079 TaxID=3239974 RepID=UPI003D95F7E8
MRRRPYGWTAATLRGTRSLHGQVLRHPRLANDLARDALQIHGGYGFARQVSATGETYRLQEIYRDAKVLEIFEGANEVLQWVIARHLIGRDIIG